MGLGQRDSIGLEYERDVHTYVGFIGIKLRRVQSYGLNDHQYFKVDLQPDSIGIELRESKRLEELGRTRKFLKD